MIPFKLIQEARGGCYLCDGTGKMDADCLSCDSFSENQYACGLGLSDCKVKCYICNGSGNGIIKHWKKTDVPDSCEFNRLSKECAYFRHKTFRPFEDKSIQLPHKVGDEITETCDACGGEGRTWTGDVGRKVSFPCFTCQGNSEATLTCQKIEHQMQDGEHGFYTEWREL